VNECLFNKPHLFVFYVLFVSFELVCNTNPMNTSTIHETPVLPPADLQALEEFSRVLAGTPTHAQLRAADGTEVAIPNEVYDVLLNVVNALSHGQAITVAPVNVRLTTQEAADYLGMSRPTIVKLLEERRIPYEQPGSGRHRKVKLADLIEYQARTRIQRRTDLASMVQDAAEAGLYDEPTPVDFLEVVEKVRKSRKR
jgi:excisionase family DNA binding protein